MQTNGIAVVFLFCFGFFWVHLRELTLASILSLSSVRLSLGMLICLRMLTVEDPSFPHSSISSPSIHSQNDLSLCCACLYILASDRPHICLSLCIFCNTASPQAELFSCLLTVYFLSIHLSVPVCEINTWNIKYLELFGVCSHLTSIYFAKLTVMRSYEMHILTG